MSDTNQRRLFFLTRLKEGADPAGFEEFVHSELLPRVRELDSVLDYRSFRIDGYTFEDEARETFPCEFIDVVEVTSVEEYARDAKNLLEREWSDQFMLGWERFVLEDFPLYGHDVG